MAEAKILTVAKDMAGRRLFANPDEASAYLNKMMTDLSDFDKVPLAAPGLDDEGNFDTEVYTDETRVMVGVLKAGKPSKVKCIVVSPVPTLAALLEDETGTDWVMKILDKELSHVSVRPLRDAEDISTMIDQMPATRADYITSGRGQSSGILQAFNELYKNINATLSAKVPAWAKARLVKAELRKCFESAGYALEYYPALEDRGEGNDSLFVLALKLGKAGATREGHDVTIFERWEDTRDNKAFTAIETVDDDTLDLDALTEEMLADDDEDDNEVEVETEAEAGDESEQEADEADEVEDGEETEAGDEQEDGEGDPA